jgi:quercetin dioxygenase-like cupin family protein
MNEKTGIVFSIADDNTPVPGCTVSRTVWESGDSYISYFSLAPHTDISAELYGYHKLLLVMDGALDVHAVGSNRHLRAAGGFGLLTPLDTPVGMSTESGTVYTEISIGRQDTMNEALRNGEVFELAQLVPYQEGRIVNMDLAHNEKMKFLIMSFDEGTGLTEHAAPGEALIFALEGTAIIGYEGEEHHIEAGENFKFAEGGKHWVKADGRFKMALLMTLG